ncbi:UvrD-helicase domain-containing protein [Virgibacillus sp. AGTR]|uniref:UvrD-helicase domain-containing protein n=1 Tax=Virgibacillus sp. AGTR TaxID=2812055 RepID=UPI001D15EDC8|nr:UvrD-helicase domain-containing protein [Virgibacillus sp. AGTR]MCC2251883.1 UvrD-helicase domain-containing protein [Virgibacillus sp. AGTR]
MYEITDEEIKWAEEILLPSGLSFDVQRRNVIKCLSSKDIIACPGSGKTTTLLAKLLILERKLPLDHNQGICVLTHTNVAIDELKNKIGNRNSRLFSYPNNFSTIQSFVNKYLAIPAYQHFFKKDIHIIDNDYYKEEFYKEFNRIFKGYRDNIIKKAAYSPVHTLLRLDYHEDNLILMWGTKPLEQVYRKGTPTYRILSTLKKRVLQRGILTFQEAFALAQDYIKTFPEIKTLISARFKYLFIDEMQDTSSKQQQVIQSIFDSDKVVTQFYGDRNQAIYEENTSNEVNNYVQGEPLSIDNSLRFSQSIANSIKNICVSPQVLKGNDTIQTLKPTIIRFNKENIQGVLSTFGELIVNNGLVQEGNSTFKAVGRVTHHNDKEKIVIPSYCPSFKKREKSPLEKAKTFNDYINHLNKTNSTFAKDYRETFIKCFINFLRHLNIRNESRYFTEKSLIDYLDNKLQRGFSDIEKLMTEWILNLTSGNNIEADLQNFLSNEFLSHFELTVSKEDLSNFFTPNLEVPNDEQESVAKVQKQSDYLYVSENGENILINIDTIHGVKGETHTATLYLETFAYVYEFDQGKIIDYLKGNHTKPKKRQEQILKLAYVGMSRPSHLLCIAIREEALEGHELDLIDLGWDIVDVQAQKKEIKPEEQTIVLQS